MAYFLGVSLLIFSLSAGSYKLNTGSKASTFCNIIGVDSNSHLPLHKHTARSSKIIDFIPPNTKGLEVVGDTDENQARNWIKISYWGLEGWVDSQFLICGLSPDNAEKQIATLAKKVMIALKKRDMAILASFAHPIHGIRFSPYAYVDISHLQRTKNELLNIFNNEKIYKWGAYDGSGYPIELSFSEYYNDFIYTHDFANTKMIGYNKNLTGGNTRNNLREHYPIAISVEFYMPESVKSRNDWASLRLIFDRYNTAWYLVGIIHTAWAI